MILLILGTTNAPSTVCSLLVVYTHLWGVGIVFLKNNEVTIGVLVGYIIPLPEKEYYLESEDKDDETDEVDDDGMNKDEDNEKEVVKEMNESGDILNCVIFSSAMSIIVK